MKMTICTPLLALLLPSAVLAVPAGAPGSEAAAVSIAVDPATVAPGARAHVTLRLTPGAGIKINKYPRIKLAIPAQPGLVAAAEAAVGNTEPPPPDHMESNYFKSIDPVSLTLEIDGAAASGKHEIAARLSYFYCVAASGYCAPAKVAVSIPVTVK